MAANPPECRPAVYARRRPEQTVLYRFVQQHLETYLALAREGDGDGHAVPGYVERERRRYRQCGILAYGFARARCPACGHDFRVAFSCKGRGICPSCNARRMAEIAAHRVDHVFPPLPVRQWVLSMPKRLRYFLEREPVAASAVLHIFLRVVEAHLRRSSPGASAQARFGAVSFVHRFGASLNRHLHDHGCILDGVFDPIEEGAVQFRQASALAPEEVAVIEEQVRRRVLRGFSRHGRLDPDDVRDRLTWDNSGFSLEHRHRYHGVLAPNAPLRLAATAYGRDADLTPPPPPTHPPPPPEVSPPAAAGPAAPSNRSPAHDLWAMLLARRFASLPLVCPNGGADMRIIAFITEATPVRRILSVLGEPAEPPRIAPARGPPAWDDPPIDLGPDGEALAQPSPEYVFNQEVQW